MITITNSTENHKSIICIDGRADTFRSIEQQMLNNKNFISLESEDDYVYIIPKDNIDIIIIKPKDDGEKPRKVIKYKEVFELPIDMIVSPVETISKGAKCYMSDISLDFLTSDGVPICRHKLTDFMNYEELLRYIEIEGAE